MTHTRIPDDVTYDMIIATVQLLTAAHLVLEACHHEEALALAHPAMQQLRLATREATAAGKNVLHAVEDRR